MLIMHY